MHNSMFHGYLLLYLRICPKILLGIHIDPHRLAEIPELLARLLHFGAQLGETDLHPGHAHVAGLQPHLLVGRKAGGIPTTLRRTLAMWVAWAWVWLWVAPGGTAGASDQAIGSCNDVGPVLLVEAIAGAAERLRLRFRHCFFGRGLWE